ncbi:hypothetical protein D3C76_1611680 [compost metagenome]
MKHRRLGLVVHFRDPLQTCGSIPGSHKSSEAATPVLQFANPRKTVQTVLIGDEPVYQRKVSLKIQVDEVHRFLLLRISGGQLPCLRRTAAFRVDKTDVPRRPKTR